MEKLGSGDIKLKLLNLKGWYLDDDAIKKDWQFADFVEAMAFMNKVADLAESHGHHPEIYNVFNRLSLRFNTHSANGITQKDFDIAADIDQIK